jgi:hypothetical protein
MPHETKRSEPPLPTPGKPPQSLVLRLAAAAGADPRTARKALRYGARAVRGLAGERLAESMAALGIQSHSAGEQRP